MEIAVIIISVYMIGVFVNRWLIGVFRSKYPNGLFMEDCIPWLVWFMSFITTILILVFGYLEYNDSKPRGKHSKLYKWFFHVK